MTPKVPDRLQEQVLTRLGFSQAPAPTSAGLRSLYSAWCRHVPFDNVRKLIHVRKEDPGPLPGADPIEFLEAWLAWGTGGTCWAGSGALHALVTSLGFDAKRGVGTMLVVPDLPPNHGTVIVDVDNASYLIDTSILHDQPLPLDHDSETTIDHPAWGVQCRRRENRWHIAWRPLHKVDGFECRLDTLGAPAERFHEQHEMTRGWSPFNFELNARLNRDDGVVGIAFGHRTELRADGGVTQAPIDHAGRQRLLIEELGMSEEIVDRLPEDRTTPPPPWSSGARSQP